MRPRSQPTLLYNWLVMRLREGERWSFKQEKARLKACREYDPELNAVYGKLLAEVYFRLDAAMQGFFRRLQEGEKPGFPRVRPRHQFFTLCYPDDPPGKSLDAGWNEYVVQRSC